MVVACDPKYDIADYLSKRHFSSEVHHNWRHEKIELLSYTDEALKKDLHDSLQSCASSLLIAKESFVIEERFRALVIEWQNDTALMSSMEMMAMHPSYQAVIGMGPTAVPLILRELAREPDHWFWALSAITGENPVNEEDAGNLERMTEAWLQLGRMRGWI